MNSLLMSLLMVPPAGGAEGQGSAMMSFLPLIAIIGIFYFLILRPQKKKQNETQKMLAALKKGDRVVTIGGIHGVIQNVRESTVIVKVDDNVKLELNRGAISTISSPAKEEKEDKKTLEDKPEDKDEESSGNDVN